MTREERWLIRAAVACWVALVVSTSVTAVCSILRLLR